MHHVKFFAAGRPKTKGSTKFVPSKFGGRAVPKTDQKLVAWQGVVSYAATAAGVTPAPGAVSLTIAFMFARPKSHYGSGRNAGKLKASAPNFPTTRNGGDIDKLQRAILDALTGVAFADDSQVTMVHASKHYAGDGESEGASVSVFALEPAGGAS